MSQTEFDVEKLNELRELSRIPTNMGEQFIHVMLNITYSGHSGDILYGLDWKKEMGELHFNSLDDAIEKVKEIRKRANLEEIS